MFYQGPFPIFNTVCILRLFFVPFFVVRVIGTLTGPRNKIRLMRWIPIGLLRQSLSNDSVFITKAVRRQSHISVTNLQLTIILQCVENGGLGLHFWQALLNYFLSSPLCPVVPVKSAGLYNSSIRPLHFYIACSTSFPTHAILGYSTSIWFRKPHWMHWQIWHDCWNTECCKNLLSTNAYTFHINIAILLYLLRSKDCKELLPKLL